MRLLPLLGIGALLSCTGREPSSLGQGAPALRPAVFLTDSLGADIRDLALGTDVWVSNRVEPSVAEYGRDGRVRWHGVMKGQGPDQALAVWGVTTIGDTTFAWDPNVKRLLRIRDGKVTTDATFEFSTGYGISPFAHGISFGNPGRLRRWGNGWVTYATEGHQGQAIDLVDMVILHFGRDGKVRDTLADLRPGGHAPWMNKVGVQPRELIPVPLWDVCRGTRFVLFEPNRQLLSWRDFDTQTRDSLRLEFAPEEIPESFMRAHLLWQAHLIALGRIPDQQLDSMVNEVFESEKPSFGKVSPYATSLFCDAEGLVWMQRFSIHAAPRGFSTEWAVIDPAHKQASTATFPEGFQALAADSTLVYGVVQDADGVQSVATLPRHAVLPEVGR